MSLFTIADLHLSFGVDKPMDVFPGWQDYTSRLEKNWRAIIDEEDTVVIAGDISWAMKLEETTADFTFLESLPGKKLLLKGNHDYWWTTRKKIEEHLAACGFHTLDIVFNSAAPVGEVCVCGSRGWFYDAESDQDKKVLNREVGRLRTSIALAKATGLEPVVFSSLSPCIWRHRMHRADECAAGRGNPALLLRPYPWGQCGEEGGYWSIRWHPVFFGFVRLYRFYAGFNPIMSQIA